MTESKFTQSPSGNELVSKINGVIDDLGYKVDTDLSNLSATGETHFQAPLTSGTNIKTINGQSVLGSGNLQTPYRNIGEIVPSIVPLTDAGLHLLDGSLLAYGSYQAFIDYIADLYDSGDYTDLFATEANWQSAVATYGVCGKFVYDDVNNTVRLPKITGKIEGTTDLTALGELAEQYVKLPNITGTFCAAGGGWFTGGIQTGAFSLSDSGLANCKSSGDNNAALVSFDASRSSSVYSGNGSDTTIHEQAIKVLCYIVIATNTKTEIEVDIDEIATDLNGKADVDLTNLNNQGNIAIAHNAMPSSTYKDLTLGASGTTYTAPADGYVMFQHYSSASGQAITIRSQVSSDNNQATVLNRIYSSASGQYLASTLPVRKGQVFSISYTTAGSSGIFLRFVYSKGSESEAS